LTAHTLLQQNKHGRVIKGTKPRRQTAANERESEREREFIDQVTHIVIQ